MSKYSTAVAQKIIDEFLTNGTQIVVVKKSSDKEFQTTKNNVLLSSNSDLLETLYVSSKAYNCSYQDFLAAVSKNSQVKLVIQVLGLNGNGKIQLKKVKD